MRNDAAINKDKGYWDFDIDANGQINATASFNTSILRSLLSERRALPDEMTDPKRRRGWIGNDKYENGSKIWLFSQSRLTRSNINRLETEAESALQWLVDDGLAVLVEDAVVVVQGGRVFLTVTIRYSDDSVENITLALWENTGNN